MSEAQATPRVITLRGRKVVGGKAAAEALVSTQTISGWGGINEREGSVIELHHQLNGISFAGKVLVFPGAKGSSGWSAYWHMLRLNGTACTAARSLAERRAAHAGGNTSTGATLERTGSMLQLGNRLSMV